MKRATVADQDRWKQRISDAMANGTQLAPPRNGAACHELLTLMTDRRLTIVIPDITYRRFVMKTSCRFAMAVHVLAVLAYNEGDPVTSALLASSVNTNPVIIRRLMLARQRAKLVETRKGPVSGSRLSRSPGRINLAQIYRAVEEAEPFSTPSRRPNAACPVGHCIRQALDRVFASARHALEGDLEKTTLASILGTVRQCAQASEAVT
jgi:DNA-binding IscR family transcriptional regulator